MSSTIDRAYATSAVVEKASSHSAEQSYFSALGLYTDCIRIADAGDPGLVRNVWISSALRRVPESHMRWSARRNSPPAAGQIVLARVEKIGKNARLELPNGRAKGLHAGDVFAAVFGNRYATNQFEGYARSEGDACEMLSMGGLCGMVVSAHSSMKEPTKLQLLGVLTDDEGKPLYLSEFALAPVKTANRPHVTVVCGTSMDAGKTHTAMSIVRGLVNTGRSVAAIKLTGTACCQDIWKMKDAGACLALDFVDGGFPSTYLCSIKDLTALFDSLYTQAAAAGVQNVVVEIADGLLQRETAALVGHRAFVNSIDAWVLAASDPLGVAGALPILRRAGIEPVAISGLLTCSPLAMREAEAVAGMHCVSAEALMNGMLNSILCSNKKCEGVVA